jgi:hypothetical protein
MNNNYLDLGNLQLLSDQLLCSKMALRNGLFPVWGLHVGGNGVLSFASGKKYLKKLQNLPKPDCQPYLRIFPLKFPFMVTLEPPSVKKGHIPLKIPRPAGQTRSTMPKMRFI